MNTDFFSVDQLHLLGDSATHPIEPPGTRPGALLLLMVLATLDKLGAASPFTVAPLKELAALVVPSSIPARLSKSLLATGVKLLRAE